MKKGRFITLEGGEGAGKTTHVQTIIDFLQQQGIPTLRTREPGGTEVAEAIRGVLLSPELPDMNADTELLLMFAARNEHLQQKITPALEQGCWVVCDRFTDATYAYQGYGRQLSLERIVELENWVQKGFSPDYTLLFDIDVATGMSRVRSRSTQTNQQIDRFEREQLEFYEKIRAGYLQRAGQYPERFRIINASGSIEQVSQQVESTLQMILSSEGCS